MANGERHEEVRHAPEAVPRLFVVGVLAATVLIATTLCIVAFLLLRLREHQLRPNGRFDEKELGAPHQVALVRQAPFDAIRDARTLADRQRADVDSFGWIDRDRRIVHIPVEDAMELLLRRQAAQKKAQP